ncbi:MAG TPA: adenylate/guanylate cyclase domain-containing protein, partial [Leptospiraceae bacterium]|nr:adenylate/guanylate cyclase domain-containing protein [Leptospiraceae bacterium]
GFQPSILVLTSRDSNADYKMIMNMGVSGIISKPFSMDTLLASVERLLADRRTAAERKQLLKYLSKSSAKIASEKAILTNGKGGARSEKKYASLLFTDIVNFTARCEKYPPDSVVEQINTIFELITKTIHKHEGDVDKFMGDACMAYWIGGEHKVSALKLIDAVQEIRDKIQEANLKSEILTKDPIRIRYGMNTGEVILCDIGSSEARIDLTVIGDHVNLAARLESASKQYGVESLLSEYTYALVSDEVEVREIDKIKVYGKNIPVVVYELLCKKERLTIEQRELLEIYNNAKSLYFIGKFAEAKKYFIQANKLEEIFPGRQTNPSKVYAGRCDFLLKNPPKEWDGVWALRK